VAEGARLESVYTARYPGFESLSLRHTFKKPCKSAKYCYLWGFSHPTDPQQATCKIGSLQRKWKITISVSIT
jgi:hypothetical protein